MVPLWRICASSRDRCSVSAPRRGKCSCCGGAALPSRRMFRCDLLWLPVVADLRSGTSYYQDFQIRKTNPYKG